MEKGFIFLFGGLHQTPSVSVYSLLAKISVHKNCKSCSLCSKIKCHFLPGMLPSHFSISIMWILQLRFRKNSYVNCLTANDHFQFLSVITKSSHSICIVNIFVLYIFFTFAHHRVPNSWISGLSICTGMAPLTAFSSAARKKLHLLQVLSHSGRWSDATWNMSRYLSGQWLTSCIFHLLAFGVRRIHRECPTPVLSPTPFGNPGSL